MNFFGFTPTIFEILEIGFIQFLNKFGQEEKSEYYVPQLVNETLQAGQASLRVLNTDSTWFGMTFLEDKAKVMTNIKKMVADKIYPSPLWT